MRDEFPAIRYRRRLDRTIENRRFTSAEEFASAGGFDDGWARSPKDVLWEPKAPAAPADVSVTASAPIVEQPTLTEHPAQPKPRAKRGQSTKTPEG